VPEIASEGLTENPLSLKINIMMALRKLRTLPV